MRAAKAEGALDGIPKPVILSRAIEPYLYSGTGTSNIHQVWVKLSSFARELDKAHYLHRLHSVCSTKTVDILLKQNYRISIYNITYILFGYVKYLLLCNLSVPGPQTLNNDAND